MSVVRRQAVRRWSVVACGIAMLCGLPVAIRALPVPGSAITAASLRARILGSSSLPYEGYAETTTALGLPALPDLGEQNTLLDGTIDQYAWYRSPGSWRAEVISASGESDTYQAGPQTELWDYGRDLLTIVTGTQPVRLPRAADLLPPALARRLLGFASPADHLSRLPSRRVAGVDAAGLRLAPADPATTVADIDVWADPANGLPVEVDVTGRGTAAPVIVTRFLDLSQRRPALATVTPSPAPGVGVTTARLPAVSGVLNGFGPPLPGRLAGLARIANPGGLADVAAYGTGFSRIAVLPLPFGAGQNLLDAAQRARAGSVTLPGGIGEEIRTPLLTVLLAASEFGGPTFLLTGAVTPARLRRAAASLLMTLGAVR